MIGTVRLSVVALVLQPAHRSRRRICRRVQIPYVSKSDAERAALMVPTKIAGTYRGGELVELRVRDRMAYVVKPTGAVDPQKRWLWEFPFWLGINDGFGNLQHRNYVEKALAAGFHVAGVDVGPSCGSPAAAEVCQEFYERLVADYGLHKRARIMGQSHGGLIAYGWAFRHPACVDRIAGICPATDFRSWPTLPNVVAFPAKGLDYGLSLEELERRASRIQPHRQPCSAGKGRRQDSAHSRRRG